MVRRDYGRCTYPTAVGGRTVDPSIKFVGERGVWRFKAQVWLCYGVVAEMNKLAIEAVSPLLSSSFTCEHACSMKTRILMLVLTLHPRQSVLNIRFHKAEHPLGSD